MSAAVIEGLDPVELNINARDALAAFNELSQSLNRYLPYTEIPDIKYRYSKGIGAVIDEAVFRAFNAESSIGFRPGRGRLSGELLPVSRKRPLFELDSLRLRGASRDEEVDAIFRDADALARGVAARFCRAGGQLLQTGKVSIDENGVDQEYDSERDPTHTIAVVSPLWSAHSSATPESNVLAWSEMIRSKTGISPNRLLVSATVMGHLQQCDEVRGSLMPLTLAPARVSRTQVSEAFIGAAGVTVEVHEAPPGMVTPPIDPQWVVLLRDDIPVGGTLYGLPLEATADSRFYPKAPQPGVVAGAWMEEVDPITYWTKAVAIGLPVLYEPDLTLSARVITS